MKDCYSAEVASVSRITPSMIRVELGGSDMRRFRSSGWPDEWVRLVFPSENGDVTMPLLVDGRWQMPANMPRSPMRPYTVRHWNAAEARMTVDFVAHEGGIASDWAAAASVGDKLGVTSPHGLYEPPGDTQWTLLIADATGLPAVGRILAERPDARLLAAHIEIPGDDDVQHDLVPGVTGAEIHWHSGFGHQERATRLLDIARAISLAPGPGYIWVAGEARETAAIRDYLRNERNIPKDRITAIGYWVLGKARD